MGGWGPWELGIVLIIVVILFGGGKLAGVGKSLGSSISEFKSALKEGKDGEEAEAVKPVTDETDSKA